MGLWNPWMSLHLCGRESIGRKFRVRHLGPAEDGQKWSDHQFRNYGIDIEIRVAALTCIGQREFSKIVDKKSAVVLFVGLDIPSVLLPQTGLKVKSVTSETAELEWTTRWAIVLWSLVSCRLLEEKTRFIWWYNHQELFYGEKWKPSYFARPQNRDDVLHHNLNRYTSDGSKKSAFSDPIEFTTAQEVRFAEIFARQEIKKQRFWCAHSFYVEFRS